MDIAPDFLTANPKLYNRISGYSKSKLALSIFIADMATRYPTIYINAVDPGIINTKMLTMDKWFDKIVDYVFRPFILEPSQSLGAIIAAIQNADSVRGCVFTRKQYFPMEKNIANHPLRQQIQTLVCTYL